VNRAGVIVTVTVLLAVATAVAWCASSLSDAKHSAADATADTAECNRLADQIRSARQSPTTASTGGDDIGARLTRAATAAELGEDAVARVAQQPPRKGRRATQVVLRSVTLRQALSFVADLVGHDRAGPTLESLQLSTAAAAGGDDDWDAELLVSQPDRHGTP
jgi:hypothetical protein